MKGPAIILVNPQMGENIGAAARAMLNCGLTELRLVAPRDGWPNEVALKNASGATSVIENAKLFDTLADAVADCHFVIGTTARARDMVKPVLLPKEMADAVIATEKNRQQPAIVFGPERMGLVNDDVVHCDALLTIPLNPDYASLNIAQAVLLAAYQWRQAVQENAPGQLPSLLAIDHAQPAPKAEVDALLSHLTDALEAENFFSNPQQRPAMTINLRNMFQRMRMTSQEAQTFHGMIKALRGGKEWKK